MRWLAPNLCNVLLTTVEHLRWPEDGNPDFKTKRLGMMRINLHDARIFLDICLCTSSVLVASVGNLAKVIAVGYLNLESWRQFAVIRFVNE